MVTVEIKVNPTTAATGRPHTTGKVDCVVCGRKKVGEFSNRVHTGWCWWCVKNKMEGRSYDSFGRPFAEATQDFLLWRF